MTVMWDSDLSVHKRSCLGTKPCPSVLYCLWLLPHCDSRVVLCRHTGQGWDTTRSFTEKVYWSCFGSKGEGQRRGAFSSPRTGDLLSGFPCALMWQVKREWHEKEWFTRRHLRIIGYLWKWFSPLFWPQIGFWGLSLRRGLGLSPSAGQASVAFPSEKPKALLSSGHFPSSQ